MKSTGIVRAVDELGRIVIPKELRKTMNIATDEPLEIFVDGDSIVLKKPAQICVICGACDDLCDALGKKICRKCVGSIKSL